MTKDCCTTSNEGNVFCTLPEMDQEGGGDCALTPATSKATSFWSRIREGVMFGIACVTSPCCTPLFVPLALALLAGTPVAVWLATHISWIYGGLTGVSVISFVLGFRWMRQKTASKHIVDTAHESPGQAIFEMRNLQEIH